VLRIEAQRKYVRTIKLLAAGGGTMEELKIKIDELEIKENDLLCAMCKPTNYGRCPSVDELLGLDELGKELGKVVYALMILRDLKDTIEHNAGS
jgi:hypothetical protein